LLREAFAVTAPDLHTGREAIDRRNSVLRCLLRLPAVRLSFAASALSLLAGSFSLIQPPLALLCASLPLAALALFRARLLSLALEAALSASLEIAEQTLNATKADVLVGSSWGGALAQLCVSRGRWSGPVVLLAPAGLEIARRLPKSSHLRAQLEAGLPQSTRGVVVHGTKDQTVPHDDSKKLSAQAPSVVLRSTGDCHRLASMLRSGALSKLVLEAARM
jgi:hypothetical protein